MTNVHRAAVVTCLVLAIRAGAAADNQAILTLAYPVLPARGAITLDGRLTPAEWDHAIKVSGFTVSGGTAIALDQTVMRLVYDKDNLYMGVKCAESQMKNLVVKCLADDGPVWRDDCIEFFIDANHDHASYWQFITNPGGARYDALAFDTGWNCAWRAKVHKEADAWYAEIAVPFKGLGIGVPTPGTVWGFNLARERRAGGGTQLFNWADVEAIFHSPQLFGHLWFVGAGWRPSATAMSRAAGLVGGKEAHVYTQGGYWIVRRGETPKAWSYRELLRAQQAALERYLTKLRKVYKQDPKMILRGEFTQLDTRYQSVRKLAAGTGLADPEACAAAKGFLDGLEDRLNKLYWRVQIELLNREF